MQQKSTAVLFLALALVMAFSLSAAGKDDDSDLVAARRFGEEGLPQEIQAVAVGDGRPVARRSVTDLPPVSVTNQYHVQLAEAPLAALWLEAERQRQPLTTATAASYTQYLAARQAAVPAEVEALGGTILASYQ